MRERRTGSIADTEVLSQMRKRRAVGQVLGEIALINETRGLALRQDELGLRPALAGAHRHHDDSNARGRQHRVNEFETIPQQQREPVPLAQAMPCKIAGDGLNGCVQRAIADALLAEHQRVAIRYAHHGFAQHEVNVCGTLRETAYDPAIVGFLTKREHELQRATRVGRPSRKPPSTVSSCPVTSAASSSSHTMVRAPSWAVEFFPSAAAPPQPSGTRR